MKTRLLELKTEVEYTNHDVQFCVLWIQESSFHWIINEGVVNRIGINRNVIDSYNSEYKSDFNIIVSGL